MAKRPKYSYDPACETLAEHFLAETVCTEADKAELSQLIQDAVEDWFLDWENKNVKKEST